MIYFISMASCTWLCDRAVPAAEFLTVLAKNVATVLSPTLVGELQDGRPNRTAVNAITNSSTTTTSTTEDSPEPTTGSSKSSNLEADTVRSAQTQTEVRPGSQSFPYNFDDNYRYNYYHGTNPQGLQRPDFGSGPFSSPGSPYSPELYRAYAGQAGPEAGSRPLDSGLQRGEQVPGVSPVESTGNSQTGRDPDSLDPSAQHLDQFRNFDRFPFGNQFSGGPGGFNNFPFQSQRQDGRFAQPLVDPFNPNSSPARSPNILANANYASSPGNPNLLVNPNYAGPAGNPNPLANANFANPAGNPNLLANANYPNPAVNGYPRNAFPSFADPFQQRQQAIRSNSFDLLPSQRFQQAYDNYPRSLQRGPNFPGFFPGHLIPEFRDSENLATPSPRIDSKKPEEASSSEVNSKSQKPEIASGQNSTDGRTATENPEVLSVQGRIRFGRVLLPALEDYSDVRFQPDSFRQYLFTDNEKDKKKNNDTSSKSSTNDV